MSRPSTDNRLELEEDFQAMARDGRFPTMDEIAEAVLSLAENSERQAEAFTQRYWSFSVGDLRLLAETKNLERVAYTTKRTFRGVGASLYPPASHTAARNLVARAFARVLVWLTTA